ncbi:MAG: molybdopterin converting factor subunit 1 [Thermoplasmata archaeon]
MSPEILLKFFASARESVGQKTMRLEVDEGTNAKDVFEELSRRYPTLESIKKQVIIAVNKNTGEVEKELEDGDEIAFLPPVSGG